MTDLLAVIVLADRRLADGEVFAQVRWELSGMAVDRLLFDISTNSWFEADNS